jgi:uncharacterized membrane protein
MEKPKGNLDDVMPPESFGTRFAHYTMLEFVFWIVIGLLLLAFEGGIIGLIIVALVAVVVGFAWRDVTRRSKSPIQKVPPEQ